MTWHALKAVAGTLEGCTSSEELLKQAEGCRGCRGRQLFLLRRSCLGLLLLLLLLLRLMLLWLLLLLWRQRLSRPC